MSTQTQCVWVESNSLPASSLKGAKTNWFLVIPARYGGGDIAVTIASKTTGPSTGMVLELRGEFDHRPASHVTVEDEQTTWSWPAPAETQLCRLLVKTATAENVDVPGPFAIRQQIEDTSNTERVVLALTGVQYRSKMVHIVRHSKTSDSSVSLADSHAEFVPSDPRDSLVTRFFPLDPGAYRLRLRWSSSDSSQDVQVRPQFRDSHWLPVSSAITPRSSDTLETMTSFDVPQPGRDVRLHFLATGPIRLPSVELTRLVDEDAGMAVAPLAFSETDEAIERSVEHAIREWAAIADEPRLAAVLASLQEEILQRALADDPWLLNYARNMWEWVHRRTVLTTYPPDICVPIADVCNARCTFCTSWVEGTKVATLEQIEQFEQVFRFSRWVGLAGHGEPLAHPRISEILVRLIEWLDPRARGYVITNGVYLDGLLDELIASRITSFAVSLNAASSAMHREVMGLPAGAFEHILSSVERIVAQRDTQGCVVSVSMVITRQNLPEVPAFIELANALGVDKIQLKTLAPAGGVIEGLNYHTLPPYDHPAFAALKANAVAAIRASVVPVQVDTDSWDAPVFPTEFQQQLRSQTIRLVTRDEALASRSLRNAYHSQPKYQARTTGKLIDDVLDFDGVNPFGRTPPFACRAPYRHLYVNDFSFNLSPCCYLPQVPGAEPIIYDGTSPFMEAWNSQALVTLRQRLRDGPLFNMCTKCPGTY